MRHRRSLPSATRSAALCLAVALLVWAPVDQTPAAAAAAAAGAAAGPATPADVAAGEKIFRPNCASCHGRSGTGGRGPDLTRGRFRHADSDQALFEIVRDGIPRVGMPGLQYSRSDQAIWQVVAYVRSLSRGRGERGLPGDPAAGKRIFRQEADCATCHRVNGEGGRRGPDLSDIGWLRSPGHLRASILKPSDHVEPRWWSARLTLSDGTTVEGLRMDDDTFSVRILDAQERLRSFRKQDLKRYERVETSTMPSYEGALDARQLDDLVAYLYSLTGKAE